MPLKLEDIIDVQQFQMLQDRLNQIYSFPSAIIDNEGKVYTATAWQDICTKFHRQHSECLKECIKSDQYIADHLHEANPAVSYRCPHGLIDNATPIIIEGVHYGNYFTGQFFLESPDLNFFRAQAKRYGFDEEAYIEAVKKVPIWTQEQLNSYLFFIKGLIEVISAVGLKNMREIEARKKLEEGEERASTILGQIQEGFWITTPPSGKIVDVNDAFCNILGYSRDEILKMSVSDVEANDSPTDVERTMQRIIQTGSAHFESCFRRKDGRVIDMDVSITYLPKQNLFFGFHRDISELKKSEKELKQSKQKLELALRAAGAGTWDWDMTTQRLDWSRELFILFGLAPDGDKATFEIWDKVMHPEDKERSYDCINHAIKEKISLYNEYRVVLPDGKIRWINALGDTTYDESGQAVRMTGICTDITERKRLEKEHLDMERQIQHSQKLESLGVLAGGIAHDFNNLLMTILGNMELAMDDISPVSPSRPYLENAHTASKRAADLTRQMLAYSGKGKFVIENMNLSELVQENIRILRASIPATINLSIQLNSDIPPIMADAGQVQQVVMNLLTNAAEAVGDHAGTITLTTGVKQCDENCLRSSRLHEKPEPGEFVYLEVTDTGSGMDKETQAKIFDPFFTTKFTGRGLGMSAMQGIILGHKGAIFVNSELGRGTTIRVNFPVSDSVAEARTATVPTPDFSSASNVSSPRSTILIVDDEEDVRQICGAMVERFGYETLTAADGEEAVAVFRDHTYEIGCIILDMTMPKMDGYATFQKLKQHRPDVKVILSSGYSEQEITQRFTGLGLAGFIQKPYRRQQLQDELERVLKQG